MITGVNKCGIPSYAESSNILGSIKINLQRSGLNLYNKEVIIVLTHTDFPDPVVPAINKCGIEVKSPIIGTPEILFPRAIGNFKSRLLKRSFDMISLKNTPSLFSLGISMPTVFLPGMTATLGRC